MEIWEVGLFTLIVALTSTVTTILYQFLRDYGTNRRFCELERRVESLDNRFKGDVGNARVREMNERMSEAMAEAAAMYHEKKPLEEIVRTLLPKYPDIALKLGGKLLKGQLGGLGGGLFQPPQ